MKRINTHLTNKQIVALKKLANETDLKVAELESIVSDMKAESEAENVAEK